QFARIANQLKRDEHYEVDEKKRTVGVTEVGIEKVEQLLDIDNLYKPENTPLIGFLNNSLKAKELYRRDRDYIVRDGEVLIVDEHTGRVLSGRRYSEGMHQSIEAREGVVIKQENQTLATITLQNYFRLYNKLSGMTGTAMTEEGEFDRIYKLGVIQIPTNKPMRRTDQADLVYRTEEAKFNAVVSDIAERNKTGQPVLIGTTSVEKSELLSTMLKRNGVQHEVLNAKQHDREAAIVAMAGKKFAVTVSTNMAGRGTDIMLGGNAEFLADQELQRAGLDPVESAEEYEAAWPAALAKAQAAVAAEHDEVVNLGGLYVLGTERHESRRIDNQLRGRSGRQGDPGESRFYLSLTDDLMRRFKSDLVDSFLRRFNVPDEVPIEAKMVSNAIKNAQTQVEQQNFEIRKNILKYDEVMNQQRKVIYKERQRVLAGADLKSEIQDFMRDTISGYVGSATVDPYEENWDLETLWGALQQLYPVSLTTEQIRISSGGVLDPDTLTAHLIADAEQAYQAREDALGEDVMRELERRVVLSVLDTKWREHLYEMDYLQNGIGLRAMGQRDPLVEYQREGYDLFVAMMDAIKEETVTYVFAAQVQVTPAVDKVEVAAPGLATSRSIATTGTDLEYPDTPRNAACPCGSGKKYKRCHGDPRR
ncbi:MAG: preprotein translocase subunit SecA, partial [Candidatus Nanopelagicales bacterium]